MKNYKTVTLVFTEVRRYGRYYNTVLKTEEEGLIPETGVPIGEVKEKAVRVRYRISKEAVREHGEFLSESDYIENEQAISR